MQALVPKATPLTTAALTLGRASVASLPGGGCAGGGRAHARPSATGCATSHFAPIPASVFSVPLTLSMSRFF